MRIELITVGMTPERDKETRDQLNKELAARAIPHLWEEGSACECDTCYPNDTDHQGFPR